MNPGATTRPSASMTRSAAAPLYLPTPTIFPLCTATSAWNAGSPEPSTTRPLLMSRSYAMMRSPHCPAPDEPGPSRRAVPTGPVVHRHLLMVQNAAYALRETPAIFSLTVTDKVGKVSPDERRSFIE